MLVAFISSQLLFYVIIFSSTIIELSRILLMFFMINISLIRCSISRKVKGSRRKSSWGNGRWKTNSWRNITEFANGKVVVEGQVAENTVNREKKVHSLLVILLRVEDL